MLTKIETKNYRNLDLEDGVTFGPLSIFVGPNGSGKSNLTRILKFIQDGLIGAPDPRRGITSFESAVADFGSGRVLDASVKAPAVVGLTLSMNLSKDRISTFELELDVNGPNAISIRKERFLNFPTKDPESMRVTYSAHTPSPGLGTKYSDKGEELSITDIPTTSFYFNSSKSTSQSKINDDFFQVFLEEFALWYSLTHWGFYESSRMNLDGIRRFNPELGPADHIIDPSGNNIVLVLHNLFSEFINFEERFSEAIRELYPQTRRIRVQAVGRSSLSLEWFVNGIDTPFYLDQMSDGTVRMLCWATVLLSPKKHKLIVIDEPEAGVHPAWLRVLAGWIREASRESQVIISTHSPDLLDYFTDDAACVRVFKQSRDNPNHNTISTLDPTMLENKLKEGWQLGDLYRVGDPSIGGWPW